MYKYLFWKWTKKIIRTKLIKKKCKNRYNTFAEKDCNNIVAWQINSWEKFLIKIDNNLDKVLIMILDMHTIYTKYLN